MGLPVHGDHDLGLERTAFPVRGKDGALGRLLVLQGRTGQRVAAEVLSSFVADRWHRQFESARNR